jgi:2'-5' RNA ligase
MYGIVSLLDQVHYSKVEAIWRVLEEDCGLSGIQRTPIPHFSWYVAKDYDLEKLQPVLENISTKACPFTVRTAGIGLFTGPNPIFYISIVKDAFLLRLHKLIWDCTKAAARFPSVYYSPKAWVPHITLAQGDTDWSRLSCAVQKLVFTSHAWEIEVDNLALISQFDDQVGELRFQCKFNQFTP